MASKTVAEIVKAKADIEKEIKELLNDFQIESGCVAQSISIKRTQHISEAVGPIYEVEIDVHLPRR